MVLQIVAISGYVFKSRSQINEMASSRGPKAPKISHPKWYKEG